MKRRQRRRKGKPPTFPPLPTKAWDIRRRDSAPDVVEALESAVNRAGRLRFAYMGDLEWLLRSCELWVDRDVLRAHVLRDGDLAPGTRCSLAFVPAGGAIEDRWYLLPPATAGTMPLRVVAIALDTDDYTLLTEHGLDRLIAKTMGRLPPAGRPRGT